MGQKKFLCIPPSYWGKKCPYSFFWQKKRGGKIFSVLFIGEGGGLFFSFKHLIFSFFPTFFAFFKIFIGCFIGNPFFSGPFNFFFFQRKGGGGGGGKVGGKKIFFFFGALTFRVGIFDFSSLGFFEGGKTKKLRGFGKFNSPKKKK